MKKLTSSLILCGALSIAGAQTAGTTGGSTAAGGSASGQTMTGILMDANCAAISSSRSSVGTQGQVAASNSNDAVQNSSTSTSAVTHSGRSSPTETIRNNSASALGTTGTADTTGTTAGRAATNQGSTVPKDMTLTAGARAADERNRIGDNTTGTLTVAGSATRNTAGGTQNSHISGAAGDTSTTGGSVSTAGNSSVTDRSGSTGATSGASSASALGTTGAATDVTTSTAAGATGDRNRSAGGNMATTVREKYAQCMPTANTTSFALHANGQLYVLDQTSNDIVRQQMSGEAFRGAMSNANRQSDFMTVTVVGTPGTGNNLTITSVRK
jgi:hypothetical protein